MQLQRMRLLNWCQFRQFEMSFARGLTAVIGPNGAGKSNILGAVRWLLTGDNPNDGEKSENICEEADPTERANGMLWLEHRGQALEIVRHLRPASEKDVLKIDGTAAARGARDVNAMLVSLLGMDSAAINRFVIVSQGDIFGVLAEQPETRAKTFQRLFDTQFAAELVEVVTKHDAALQLNDFRPQLDQLTQQHATATAQLQEVHTAMTDMASPESLEATLTADRQVVADYATKQQRLQQLTGVRAELSRVATQQQTLTTTLTQHQADLAVLENAAAGLQVSVDTARAALQNAAQVHQAQQKREELTRQRATVVSSLAALVAPTDPLPGVDVDQLHVELSELSPRLAANSRFVQQFVAGNATECPTCHTPVTTLASRIDETRRAVEVDTARAKELNTTINAARNYVGQKLTYESNVQQLNSHLAQIDAHLAGLTLATSVVGDLQACHQTIADHAAYVDGSRTLQTAIHTTMQQLSQLNGTHAALQASEQTLVSQTATVATTEAEAQAAQSRIADRTVLIQRSMELQRHEAGYLATVTTLERQITDLQAKIAESDRLRAWLADGEEVKSVLKLLPKLIARRNLQDLEQIINDLLGLCGVVYRVAVDETLSFTGRFPNGRVQRAKRFSGGQKVWLALLFRIAATLRFAGDIGFLALDEPTVYLDKRSIAAFQPLFARLRELLAQRGLQCLIITHEEELAPLFDTVVSIEVR